MELCNLKEIIDKYTKVHIVDNNGVILYEGKVDCVPFTNQECEHYENYICNRKRNRSNRQKDR